MEPIAIKGCRHDILGHYLKAIGLLRVLARCADEQHRDPEAEGWWDADEACFYLRSEKYPDREALVEFFAKHYMPTPVMSAWKKNLDVEQAVAEQFGLNHEHDLASKFSRTVVEAKNADPPTKRSGNQAFAEYRNDNAQTESEALDAIAAPVYSQRSDNPLWLSKGAAGRVHVLGTHWEYLRSLLGDVRTAEERRRDSAMKKLGAIVDDSLLGIRGANIKLGKGTPFFPEAIKSYNMGSGWVNEKVKFNPLDYNLAVEGAYAMRGTASRALAMNARRYAAFPFVFDTGEEATDDKGIISGTSSALWFPVWERPSTFTELSSFIGDAQAKLQGREARFSAEFIRAMHLQGVDAGFAGWQEFRFRMKSTRVPWITTGRYIATSHPNETTLLNLALRPLDESNFLDQFEIRYKGNEVDARSPHPVRAMLIEAMEDAFVQPTAGNALALLEAVFSACKRMAVSKSFREVLRGGPIFFAPLPMEHWERILKPLESEPEFRIARALASMSGRERQADGSYSGAQPMLGSVLPLAHGRRWYLPDDGRSRQAVWSGTDIALDLCAVLRRRYMDSLDDDRPALRAVHGAELNDVLAFLEGELDDQRIMRWTEALSLIGWRFPEEQEPAEEDGGTTEGTEADRQRRPIPMAYAALRTLLDLECEWQGKDRSQWKKRRSQQPFALLAQRSGSALPGAVAEALRWISIWGVRNPWGREALAERPVLSGRQVLNMTANAIADPLLASRLAAAVCIPLRWQDRWLLHRAVTLPQHIEQHT